MMYYYTSDASELRSELVAETNSKTNVTRKSLTNKIQQLFYHKK